jgi:hypothetical protein
MTKSKLLISLALVFASLAGIPSAYADTVLVDRGLPTANLNNIAGPDRSNVAWTEGAYTTSSDYWLIGDTFTNTSSEDWNINTIQLWTVGPTITATLWGGVEGSTIGIGVVSNASSITPTTYAGGITYQGTSGSYIPMYQVDFSTNVTLAAGQTYDFFLDGTGAAYIVPFVSASNAALSGSPQDGADGSMLEAHILDGSVASSDAWTSLGNGWDKASDVNVVVSGTVPEPETYAMMLGGLGLLGFMVCRMKQKATPAA